MAKIFISHSSKDKEFVDKLSRDLNSLGHEPWLDIWQVKVGECIVSKVEHGIKESDYVVIVLTENSVNSGWVEREWKSKYWDEINQGKTLILPVLLSDCEIPQLLKTKRYADFRINYSVALVALAEALGDRKKQTVENDETHPIQQNHAGAALITKFQSRNIPLSQSIAETYLIAKRIKDKSLLVLCEGELTGWSADKIREFRPTHRMVKVFTSFGQPINMQYVGWGGNASTIIDYMKGNPDEFKQTQIIFSQSIAKLEAEASIDISSKMILSIALKAKDFVSGFTDPDFPIYAYAHVNAYRDLFEAIRNEFTKRLMVL
jgi:hypothetical protein